MEIDRRSFLKIVGFSTLGLIGASAVNQLANKIPSNLIKEEVSEREAITIIEKLSNESPRRYALIKYNPNLARVVHIPKIKPLTADSFNVPLDTLDVETITINITELEYAIFEKYSKAIEDFKRPWGILLCPEHEIALSYCFDRFFKGSGNWQRRTIMGLDVMRSDCLNIEQSPLII